MPKSPDRTKSERQDAMTGYLSLTALTLAGLLVLVLVERYM